MAEAVIVATARSPIGRAGVNLTRVALVLERLS